MKVTAKDTVGLVLVLGTLGTLILHNAPTGHRANHIDPVADAGGSITSPIDVRTVAFVNVNVVPMDRDRVLRRQVVVVRNGFVSRIGPVGVVEPPEGARIIDGGGTRYLAPGLADAHVHLGNRSGELLPLFLANGVTTVFNLEGDGSHVTLRDGIRRGAVVGPALYTAGPFQSDETIRSPDDARRAVFQHKERGYDFLKVHGDLDAESFETLTRVGLEEGIAIIGHVPRNLPFSAVLANRQASVTHAEDLIYTQFVSLNEQDLGRVATEMADAGTWLTPGLAHFENIAFQWAAPEALEVALARPTASFLAPSLLAEWRSSNEWIGRDATERSRIQSMADFHRPLLGTLHDAGVPMLAGTDSPLPGMVPGFSLHDEIVALNRVGFSPYEALSAATRNAGQFIRQHVDGLSNFGTVEVGARADLLLLDRDPRHNLETLRAPSGVMVRGTWYDRSALDSMLSRVAGERRTP